MGERLDRLGATTVVASTNTELIKTQPNEEAYVLVTACNRGSTERSVRLAHIDSTLIADIANEDYLWYDLPIDPNGSLEKGGITMAPDQVLMVYADHADVNFMAHGSKVR